VSDKDIPTSGSRWEPADGTPEGTSPQPAVAAAGVPAQPPVVPQELPPGQARETRLPRRLRGRGAVAAAGVGLVLAGGLGGFAVGHAVSDDVSDGGTVTDQNGVPDDGHGGRPDFRDGERPVPGGGQPDGSFPDGSTPRDTSPDVPDDGGTA